MKYRCFSLALADTTKQNTIGLAAFLAALLFWASALPGRAAGYVVVISESSWSDPAWQAVAAHLQAKHTATIIRFDGAPFPEATRRALSEAAPDYVCFVAQPAEVTRVFVEQCHRMLRRLDADRYTDALWGIVTGYDASHALRLASHSQPLAVQNALLKTAGDWLEYLYGGEYHSEMDEHHFWSRTNGGAIVKTTMPEEDDTPIFVQKLNQNTVDFMVTSGHANEYTWQLHYPSMYPEGYFMAYRGELEAQDAIGMIYSVNSTNAKIYYAPGNCLIGHIPEDSNREYSLALGWLGSGGAAQMAGYVADTWFGYMGWGVAEYFIKQQERFTFAESCYLINQALLFDLAHQTPGLDPAGLAYDRDVFVLYGDPAYPARLRPVTQPDYDQTLTSVTNEGRVEFTLNIQLNRPVNVPRPVIAFLPTRIYQPRVEDNAGRLVDVADNLVLVQLWKEGEPDLASGQTWTVRFSGDLTNAHPVVSTNEVRLVETARTFIGPPLSIKFTPDGSNLYGALWEEPVEGARLLRINPATLEREVVTQFGRALGKLSVSLDGGRVFAPNYYYHCVMQFDLRNGNRVSSQALPTPGSWAGRSAVTPDYSKLVVLSGMDGRDYDMGNDGLAIYDIRDGAFNLLAWVQMQDEPTGFSMGFSPDGQYGYVMGRARQSTTPHLYEIRLAPPYEVTRKMSVPVYSYSGSSVVCVDNRVIFSDGYNHKLWVVNRDTWTFAEYPVEHSVGDIEVHPDGKHLFMMALSEECVVVWDLDTMQEVGRSEGVGEERYADMEISPDGKRLYIAYRNLIAMDIILPQISGTLHYMQDFGQEPRWIEDATGGAAWNDTGGVLQGVLTNAQGAALYLDLPQFNPNRSWQLEWEQVIQSCDYGAGLTFGLWDPAMNIVMPGTAAVEMGNMDCGRGVVLYGGGAGRNQCQPEWRTGVWYRCRLFYDARHHRLALHVLERQTGALVGWLDMQVELFPRNMTRLGISRMHLRGTDAGGLGAATVAFALDNVRLYQEPEPPPGEVSITMIPSVVIQGVPGRSYRVEYATSLQGNNPWQVLTNVTLPSTPYAILDPAGAGQPKRFYRVMPAQ